jgi:hypothetical protein
VPQRALALALLLASPDADLVARLVGAPPPALEGLAASVRSAERLPVTRGGELNVENVRRRLGLLEALEGAARPQLHEGALGTRLQARLLVGSAHQRFAEALAAAPTPEAAFGEAAAPWQQQLEATLSRLRLTAAAHLRSCTSLARAAGATGAEGETSAECGRRLSRLPGLGEPLPEAPAALAAARGAELQGCVEKWGSEGQAAQPVAVTARLSLDRHGAVAAAELSGGPKAQGLELCLRERLRLWVFPGLSDAEIELPLKLSATAR